MVPKSFSIIHYSYTQTSCWSMFYVHVHDTYHPSLYFPLFLSLFPSTISFSLCRMIMHWFLSVWLMVRLNLLVKLIWLSLWDCGSGQSSVQLQQAYHHWLTSNIIQYICTIVQTYVHVQTYFLFFNYFVSFIPISISLFLFFLVLLSLMLLKMNQVKSHLMMTLISDD